jgi:hypothetical protein
MRKFPKYIGNNVSVDYSKTVPLILVTRYNGAYAVGDFVRFEGEDRLQALFNWLKSYLLEGTPPEKGTGPRQTDKEYKKFVENFKSIEVSVTDKRVVILFPMVPERGGKIGSPEGPVKVPFDWHPPSSGAEAFNHVIKCHRRAKR